MDHYQPETLLQRLLARLVHKPGYIGRSTRRKLKRRYQKRAQRDFDALLKTLTDKDIVLDLGANLGVFTEAMARTGAIVHAYEPDPETFEKLKIRVGSLSNVHLHNKAVGAKPGVVSLFRSNKYDDDPDAASQASSISLSGGHLSEEPAAEVEVEGFFDVLAQHGNDVALVKMDIEGAEWDILAEIFEREEPLGFRHLFCETHESLETDRLEMVNKFRDNSGKFVACTVNLYWC